MNSQDYIADHAKNLPRSEFGFFAIVSEMPQAISLGIGEPDFITPWKIQKHPFLLWKKVKLHTLTIGIGSLAKEISSYVSSFFGPEYDPQSEVLVTVGVSEAIDIALRAILNPGTRFFIMSHVMFHMLQVTLAHGEPVSCLYCP